MFPESSGQEFFDIEIMIAYRCTKCHSCRSCSVNSALCAKLMPPRCVNAANSFTNAMCTFVFLLKFFDEILVYLIWISYFPQNPKRNDKINDVISRGDRACRLSVSIIHYVFTKDGVLLVRDFIGF